MQRFYLGVVFFCLFLGGSCGGTRSQKELNSDSFRLSHYSIQSRNFEAQDFPGKGFESFSEVEVAGRTYSLIYQVAVRNSLDREVRFRFPRFFSGLLKDRLVSYKAEERILRFELDCTPKVSRQRVERIVSDDLLVLPVSHIRRDSVEKYLEGSSSYLVNVSAQGAVVFGVFAASQAVQSMVQTGYPRRIAQLEPVIDFCRAQCDQFWPLDGSDFRQAVWPSFHDLCVEGKFGGLENCEAVRSYIEVCRHCDSTPSPECDACLIAQESYIFKYKKPFGLRCYQGWGLSYESSNYLRGEESLGLILRSQAPFLVFMDDDLQVDLFGRELILVEGRLKEVP